MVAPGPVTAGTFAALASGTSIAVPVPSGVAAGDIIFVELYLEAARTITPPVGFSAVAGNPNSTTQQYEHLFWKRATAADSGTYTFTWSPTSVRSGRAYRVPGAVTTGTPFDTPARAARSSNGTVTPVVALTTTGPERLLLWFATNFQAGTWTPPSGYTELADNGEITAASRVQTSAGPTGDVTGTGSNSGGQTATLIPVIPAVITAVPVQASVDAVEVAAEPAPVKVSKRATVAAAEVAAEVAPVRVSRRATAAAAEVAVEVLPVVAELLPPKAVVDVVVEPTPLRVSHTVRPAAVEAAAEPLPVRASRNVRPPAVEVAAEVLPVAVRHVVRPAAAEAAVEVLPVKVQLVVRVAPIDLGVETRPVTAGGTIAQRIDVLVEVLPVTVSYGGTGVSRRGLPPVIFLPTTRVMAQSILDGRWLHWELPVTGLEVTWALSGPTVIAGKFEPEIRDLADAGLTAWGTWIHVEDAGLIRASGILQPTTADGETLSMEAVGVSGYAARIPYRGKYSQVGVDPADVVRHLWAHIQSHPRGNLGVQVHGSTAVRLGTEESKQVDFVTGSGEAVSFDRGGPYKLDWFENKLIGSEINNLAGDAPFDYIERSRWNAAKTYVEQHIDIYAPQAGARRFDLRFAQGENVLESAPVEEPDGVYADQVYVQGRGEGETAIAGYAGTAVGNRLRMPVVVMDKTIPSKQRADARAAEELAARLAALVEVPEIAVSSTHLNAPLGSYSVGDEIRVDLDLPYVGRYSAWSRITSITYMVERDAVSLSLSRRGEFASR